MCRPACSADAHFRIMDEGPLDDDIKTIEDVRDALARDMLGWIVSDAKVALWLREGENLSLHAWQYKLEAIRRLWRAWRRRFPIVRRDYVYPASDPLPTRQLRHI